MPGPFARRQPAAAFRQQFRWPAGDRAVEAVRRAPAIGGVPTAVRSPAG